MSGLTQEVLERRVYLNTAELAVLKNLVESASESFTANEATNGFGRDTQPLFLRISEKLRKAMEPRRRDR